MGPTERRSRATRARAGSGSSSPTRGPRTTRRMTSSCPSTGSRGRPAVPTTTALPSSPSSAEVGPVHRERNAPNATVRSGHLRAKCERSQCWSDRVAATGLALYGRKVWETMSSHWPTADQQPGATPAQMEFAHRWRDMLKVVFSSTTSAVDWNARLVTGDAVTEVTRLKTEDGGPMDIGGATLPGAAMRAGLIDEYAIVTHPVLLGGGTPFFTALDNWVNLNLVETRTFPDGVLLTRYETRRGARCSGRSSTRDPDRSGS